MKASSRTSSVPSSRGSAEVEAALIIPLVILIIVGMVKLGVQLFEKVDASCLEHQAYAEELAGGGKIPEESVLRTRWYFR